MARPTFGGPAVTVLTDVRLDLEEGQRGELTLEDFALCAEVCRLMTLLDQVQKGQISKIEVRAGIPRRVTPETSIRRVL
jgi:hypothetical protein